MKRNIELTGAELQKFLDRCWTINDMINAFQVTGMTIHNWRAQRGLPTVVISGDRRPALRFMPSEVAEWARRNNVPMRSGSRTQRAAA
jgi:hypothetical protein